MDKGNGTEQLSVTGGEREKFSGVYPALCERESVCPCVLWTTEAVKACEAEQNESVMVLKVQRTTGALMLPQSSHL